MSLYKWLLSRAFNVVFNAHGFDILFIVSFGMNEYSRDFPEKKRNQVTPGIANEIWWFVDKFMSWHVYIMYW